ncbi:MAG: hypothetical protein ABSH56_11895 [Bryobacteraceae bacterium]|jgi:hypothetical protein
MDQNLKRLIEGMDASQLDELQAAARAVRNSRTAVDLDNIRPGMKAADREHAREEIARILREGQ